MQWPFETAPVAQFLKTYQREHATTLKLLRAFPADKMDFRPSERSNTAHKLAWTFVAEETMMLKAIRNEPVFGTGQIKLPETWDGIIEAFEKQHADVVRELEARQSETLTNKVGFFIGPKQPGEFPAMDFLWMLLCDQIHHRGQLSVYIRMVGGKLPSIYGPTADEPWT
ncbi:MAG TPA: DinB family protein [Thermoanaerobaculia bacterium]|nr:DinB family protein [Thermoanaerobaculia bacterium]